MRKGIGAMALVVACAAQVHAESQVGIGIPCRVYARKEFTGTSLKLPRKVAAVVVCRGPGLDVSGELVTAETAFIVQKNGGVFCSSVDTLDPVTGALLHIDADGCGFFAN